MDTLADDLNVAFNGDIVTVSAPKGLALSPTNARMAAAQALDSPKPAPTPGLIGGDWANVGAADFIARYDALLAPVADEQQGPGRSDTGPHGARPLPGRLRPLL